MRNTICVPIFVYLWCLTLIVINVTYFPNLQVQCRYFLQITILRYCTSIKFIIHSLLIIWSTSDLLFITSQSWTDRKITQNTIKLKKQHKPSFLVPPVPFYLGSSLKPSFSACFLPFSTVKLKHHLKRLNTWFNIKNANYETW